MYTSPNIGYNTLGLHKIPPLINSWVCQENASFQRCPLQPSRGEREQLMNGKVTYRQQYTRCGKQRCRKCKEGAGHGPYWYAYWSENGRTISKYIGIHPPAEVEAEKRPLLSVQEAENAKAGQSDVLFSPLKKFASPHDGHGTKARDEG